MLTSLLLAFGLSFAHAEFIVHEAFCAGLLNPRAGKVMDSFGDSSYQTYAHHEAYYVIEGRTRRISIGTQESFADDTRVFTEPLPEDRIEVPMVNERLPLYSRQIIPVLRNLYASNLVRRARVLFNDRKDPKVVMSERKGRVRFTYQIASGESVDVNALTRIAEQLHIKGFSKNQVWTPGTREVEVAIRDRVFTGREFYQRLASAVEIDAETRWQSFARFLTGKSLVQLARNALTPADKKVGYRPRYVFPANKDGELTPRVMNDVATDLDERTNGAPLTSYDVVVGDRAFSGEDFEEVRKRMITDGVVSIDAERGFQESLGGVAAVTISQVYTMYFRLAGLITIPALVTPGLQGKGLLMAGVLAAVSVTGSVVKRSLDNSESPHMDSRTKRTFRTLGYLLPNFSGLLDSSSYNAVEARRAQLIAENVGKAITRHQANEIVIITNGTHDIRRIKQAFNAKFQRALPIDSYPLMAASRLRHAREPDLQKSVKDLNALFERRDFASAQEFVEYFDPRRFELFTPILRTPEGAAWFAYYFFKNLRAALPEFRRWAPTDEQEAALAGLPKLFAPYELVPSYEATLNFDFKSLRRAPITTETAPD